MTERQGGFYYSFSREKLAWWKAVPFEQKLQWLEEANAFLQKAMTKEKQEIMQAFRRGKLGSKVEEHSGSDT